MEINNPELSGSAGTAALLPPTFSSLCSHCCADAAEQSCDRARPQRAANPSGKKPERMRILLPEETSPYMGTPRTRARTRPAGLLRSDPNQMEDVSVKTRGFRKRIPYFCFARTI